jgi:hypothetical protein
LTAADPANDMIPIVDVSDTPPASGNTKRISINNLLACSPSATLASATITGDLTVDTSTLKVDSTNDRVLIGTLTALGSAKLSILGKTQADTAVAGDVIGNFNNTSATGYGLRIGGGSATGGYALSVNNNAGSEFHQISGTGVVTWSNVGGVGSTAMTLNASGLGVGVTPSAGKGCLQLVSGINFPATQVASSDANTLDDYEEGTWTGTLKGSVSDPTTPVTATGRYTKIGRQVLVVIDFGAFNSTGASGNASIIGLPFANGLLSVGSVESGSALTFSGTLAADILSGGTTIQLQSIISNAYAVFATHNAGNPRYLTVSINYSV